MKCQSIVILLSLIFCTSFLSSCSNNGTKANAPVSTQQYTINETFDMYLKNNKIQGQVLYFTADYYNDTDKIQAFALVGTNTTGDLWFTNSQTFIKLLNSITVTQPPTVVSSQSKLIYIINGTTADGIEQSYAYTVTDENPIQLENAGENLTSMGNNDFFTTVTYTDKTNLGGETHKKHYLYFDGNSLKEYGGISILESQFLKLNKSDTILNSISECGYTVTDIIYRANSLININCEKAVDGNIIYENVTVKVLKNNAIYIPSGLNQNADYVGRSSYGGKYLNAAFPETATYPNNFLVE